MDQAVPDHHQQAQADSDDGEGPHHSAGLAAERAGFGVPTSLSALPILPISVAIPVANTSPIPCPCTTIAPAYTNGRPSPPGRARDASGVGSRTAVFARDRFACE